MKELKRRKIYKILFDDIKDHLFAYFIILILLNLIIIKLPYTVESPGGLINVEDRLSNIEYESTGSFNETYVTSRKGSVLNLIMAKILPNWDIIPNSDIVSDGETMEDTNNRYIIQLYEGISNSTYVAYNKANVPLNITSESNYVYYVDELANTTLKVGDKILSYDDIDFTSYDTMGTYLNTKQPGDIIHIKVLRNGTNIDTTSTMIDYNGRTIIGILVSSIYSYENNPNIQYTYKSSESGSSGGLMLTLAIYDALTEEDITHGLTISGTGTIDRLGNVGEIAGVKYKLSGAVKSHADVFLVPTENYEEAMQVKEDNNYDIQIIEAKTFDQVLEELAKLEN